MQKKRLSLALLTAYSLSAGAIGLLGQSAGQSGQSAPAPAQDDVVEMSQFVVRTTAGLGYADSNSVSGFKTNQALLDIPQSELVLTQDLMQDIGVPSKFASDLWQYAGIATWYRGPAGMIRGSRVNATLVDGMESPSQWNRDYIDSTEVLKGTISVLYQGSATTGTILESTKKPLLHQQDIVMGTATTDGGFSATIDSTGPVGTVGDVKLNYRVIASLVSNGQWFVNDGLNEKDIHPSLEFDYKNTSFLVAYSVETVRTTWNSNGILTPSGDLYTGAGYAYAGNWFPGLDKITGLNRTLDCVFIEKISDSWENKLCAIYSYNQEYGGNAVITGENYQTNSFSGIFRQNNNPINYFQILDDATGKYTFWGIPFQTTTGFAHLESDSTSKFWTTVNDGPNTFTVPMGSAAAINAVHVPTEQQGEYNVPANPGSRSLGYSDLVYLEQQVDAVPNLVSLVAGWAYTKTESISDTNIAVNTPYASTDTGYHYWVPRWGIVVHVLKSLSLYGLDSQSAGLNGYLDYFNNRLPNVQILSKEVGLKANLWSGRIIADFAVFRTVQTNQAVYSGLTNPQGVGYYVDVGTTTNEGWDSSIAAQLLPGLQLIATGYVGTVKNQANTWVSPAFGNMVTAWVKYDMPKDSILKQLSVGGGVSRIGQRYLTTGGMTFPVGWTVPAFFKIHAATQAEAFLSYKITKNFSTRLGCTNLLDAKYAIGSQSPGTIDPSLPRDFQLSLTATF